MPIGKVLLLKGLGGLAAIGGTIGGGYYIYNHYYSNLETRFDRGLIEFLEVGGNIQFSVKEGNGSGSDISDSFPTFTNGATPPTATVTIKVSVNATASSGGTNDGTLTDKTGADDGVWGTKKYLQKLNGDEAAWTWECKIVFEKPSAVTETELKDKDKLVKSSEPKGFFNKLKDTDTTNKDLKIKFIKDCAAARGKDKNKEINKKQSLSVTGEVITNANQIDSKKKFKLRKGVAASGEEEGKLYPVDKSDFNYWFVIK